IEKIENLHLKDKKRLTDKNFTNIYYKQGDGTLGWKEHEPYDRIMVTASASEVPEELLNQLATGGKMIIPVGKDYIQELRLIEKDEHGSISSTHLNDVAFVSFTRYDYLFSILDQVIRTVTPQMLQYLLRRLLYLDHFLSYLQMVLVLQTVIHRSNQQHRNLDFQLVSYLLRYFL